MAGPYDFLTGFCDVEPAERTKQKNRRRGDRIETLEEFH